MHPVLHLGCLGDDAILSYQLFAVLALIAGWLIAILMLRRAGLRMMQIMGCLLPMTVLFLVGARLWNIMVNPDAYTPSAHAVLNLWSFELAGFSVYGGILGAFIALIVFSGINHIDIYRLLDALVLPSGFAFAVARVGCYLNGCCRGKVTESFLGVAFPQAEGSVSQLFGGVIPIVGELTILEYPTQIFEMGLALVGLIPAMILYVHHKRVVGIPFLFYGIWFCLMRWGVLSFRALPYSPFVVNIAYPVFYGGLTMVLAALLLKKRMKTAAKKP